VWPPPPTLGERQNLADLVTSGGFQIEDEGEVECVFLFSDVGQAYRGIRAAGMVEAAARGSGEERLREAVLPVLSSLAGPDGSVRLSNWFRYMVGR
jgi:hypothetical protein